MSCGGRGHREAPVEQTAALGTWLHCALRIMGRTRACPPGPSTLPHKHAMQCQRRQTDGQKAMPAAQAGRRTVPARCLPGSRARLPPGRGRWACACGSAPRSAPRPAAPARPPAVGPRRKSPGTGCPPPRWTGWSAATAGRGGLCSALSARPCASPLAAANCSCRQIKQVPAGLLDGQRNGWQPLRDGVREDVAK